MRITQAHFNLQPKHQIIGLDVEWTKNYQIRDGNRPFCFSLVSIDPATITAPKDIEVQLTFGYYSCYIDSEADSVALCAHLDDLLASLLCGCVTIVGHQLSSDIAIVLNAGLMSADRAQPAVSRLRELWHQRHIAIEADGPRVFDTRYDLPPLYNPKSNRLVDVCLSWQLDVLQPEISGSMTKMQRDYYVTHASDIADKIAILNLRHSLSSALLYALYTYGDGCPVPINVNRILHRTIGSTIPYVVTPDFIKLLNTAGRNTKGCTP